MRYPSHMILTLASAAFATLASAATVSATSPSPAASAAAAPQASSTPAVGFTPPNVSPVTGGTTSAELATLQSQNSILKLKAENAEFEARIRKAQKADDNSATGLNASLPSPAAMPAPISLPSMRGVSDIDIRSITAFDGRYRAVLNANGRMYDVAAGDRLDGGWTVRTISGSGVTLAKGKKTRTIDY